MAEVPVASQTVGARAIDTPFDSGAGATAGAFGAGAGDALSRLGGTVGQLGDEAIRIANERQLQDNALEFDRLKGQYVQQQNLLRRGDSSEGSKGWKDQFAGDAVDTDENSRDASRRMRKVLIDSGSNSNVQEAFTIWSMGAENSEFAAMSDHLASQTMLAHNNADEAMVAQLSQQMADDPVSGERNTRRLGQIENHMNDLLDREGVTDQAERSLRISARLTVAHEGVINRLLQQDPALAQSYYDTFINEILPLSRAGIESELKTGVVLQQAQQIAKQVFDPSKTRGEMQEQAREMAPDARTAKEAVQELRIKQEAFDADERQADDDAREAAAEHIKANPTGDLPPKLVDNMTLADGVAMRRLQRQAASREPVAMDDKAYQFFDQEMAKVGRDAATINLLDAESRLSTTEFNLLRQHKLNAQQGLLDPDNPASLEQMIKSRADQIGLRGTDTKIAQRGRFQSMVRQEVAREQEEKKGRQLNTQEINELLDRMETPMVRQNTGVFSRIFNPTTAEAPFKNAVPVDSRREITEAYRAAGLPPPSRSDIARIHFEDEELPEAEQSQEPRQTVTVPDTDRQQIIDAFTAAGRGTPTEEQIRSLFRRNRGQ